MNPTPNQMTTKLRDGLERLALVLRADLWTAASETGLNPAQIQVLGHVVRHPSGLRPKNIAARLSISPASIADTLAALERKGLLTRQPDPADARAVLILVTREGKARARAISEASSQIATALTTLTPGEQAGLLLAQVKIIAALQRAGAIPIQRLCVNCRYFRPNIHSDVENPHHCAFVDTAFGNRDIRLDCGDHETADPALQSANWMAFDPGSASLQAPG